MTGWPCQPNCEGCWRQAHDGHNTGGFERVNGELIAAHCWDCGDHYNGRTGR